VTYGVLTDVEIERMLVDNPTMTRNRRLLAIPFVGKDCPSKTNEFSHPDVCIGLTALSYRYGGLRGSDVVKLVTQLQGEMQLQPGPYAARPSCVLYAQWVQAAGAHVRGQQATAGAAAGTVGYVLRSSSTMDPLHV